MSGLLSVDEYFALLVLLSDYAKTSTVMFDIYLIYETLFGQPINQRNTPHITLQVTPYILSCKESRKFHLSWASSYVTLRHDDVTGKEVLRWYSSVSPLDVNYVTLSSGDAELVWGLVGSNG